MTSFDLTGFGHIQKQSKTLAAKRMCKSCVGGGEERSPYSETGMQSGKRTKHLERVGRFAGIRKFCEGAVQAFSLPTTNFCPD